jgi:predicted  nucleic acid-binding Zn-ribbon protein
MAVIRRSERIIEATEAWVEALRGKTMLEANEARDVLRTELVEVDRLEAQLAGAVEAERAEIVTLLQEIADAEPRMSEARLAVLAAAKRIHARGGQ